MLPLSVEKSARSLLFAQKAGRATGLIQLWWMTATTALTVSVYRSGYFMNTALVFYMGWGYIFRALHDAPSVIGTLNP
jgi:hypothetical protein